MFSLTQTILESYLKFDPSKITAIVDYTAPVVTGNNYRMVVDFENG